MKKIVSLSVLMLMIGSCAYAQKEYRQIREQLKNKNKTLFDKKQIKVNDSDIVEYIKNNLNDTSSLDI